MSETESMYALPSEILPRLRILVLPMLSSTPPDSCMCEHKTMSGFLALMKSLSAVLPTWAPLATASHLVSFGGK